MIVVFTTIIQTTDLAIQDLDQNKTHSKVDQLFHSFPKKKKETQITQTLAAFFIKYGTNHRCSYY